LGSGQNSGADHGTGAGESCSQGHIAVHSNAHSYGLPLTAQILLNALDAAQEVVVPGWTSALWQLNSEMKKYSVS